LSVLDVLELRKLKKKSVGVDAAALLRGDPLLLRQKAEEEKARRKKEDADPWRLKTGGLVDLGEVKGMAFGEEPVSIGGGGFAAASNTMDTEKKMQEFIEQELSKRRQGASDPSTELSASNDTLSTIEDGANGPPLDEAQKPQSEGNVSFSAAMLTSIPVVDLGVSTKLDNIEATEKARRDLMDKKKQLKDVDALTGPMNSGASVRCKLP
ncbi:hepatocellular carcinoma-associated antigen 59-domain-containing protein, partial [Chytriomyces cf. hyalinus JEL632]